MTDVYDILKSVQSSQAFKTFKKKNPTAYLAHIFCHIKEEDAPVEFGFYDKKEDTITVFTTNPVTAKPPEQVFKESGVLHELDSAHVKIGLAQAREIAAGHREEKYATHPVSQEICILQQAEGPVWNITLVTETLNMYNLRINAQDGSLLSDEMHNIMDLRK